MMTGNFDLAIGGISGPTLNASAYLDVFADDNRGGFTLNQGINTSSAVIPVEYEVDGETIRELWSFNAIQLAFTGGVIVVDGVEVD